MIHFFKKLFVIYLFASPALANDQHILPNTDDIKDIKIYENEQMQNNFYTKESLLRALPNFKKANIDAKLGFGKVWLWQRGEFILKNGNKIPWRTFAANIILIESKKGAHFYTDVTSTSSSIRNNKLIITQYTPTGFREIEISLEPER